MATLGWNGLSETHENLAGLLMSDQSVSLSQWTPNLNWMCIGHSYDVQIIIWTSYLCSCFQLLHYYRDSAYPQRSWASELDTFELEIPGKIQKFG